MVLLRALARPMLAVIFVTGGIEVLRKPHPRAEQAAPVIDRVRRAVPVLPADPVTLVRANAAVHMVAGAMLATGRAPRLAAGLLAASLVPTTIGGHRFWAMDDPVERARQRTHVGKNLAILGGLLLAAAQEPDERRRGR
jgi:putative oxidoreductase